MVAYFVSDIHLRSIQEVNARLLVRFLKSMTKKDGVTHLFFVGDIFDFWISDHKYFIQKFEPIINEVQRIISEDITVYYFEGNHDLYLRNYWTDRLGVKVFRDHEVFQLNGFKVRVEHGDLIDPDDKGYLFLRKMLRTPIMEYVAHNSPEKVISTLGEKASQASRYYTTNVKTQRVEETIDKIHSYAQKKIKETEFDFIVTGHVHVRDEYSFVWGDKRIQSINLGSWMQQPTAYRITEKGGGFVEI